MKEYFSLSWFLAYAMGYGSICVIAAFSLAACPPGTKTSVDVSVKVNADLCSEDKLAPDADSTWAHVTCPSIEAGTTVHVLFPRREWNELKMAARDAGPTYVDAGPGK